MIIWVFMKKTAEGTFTKSSARLLEQAQELADESHAEIVLMAYPADDDILSLVQQIHSEKPDVLLFVSSPEANALAARLAIRLDTGVSTDCYGMKYISGSEAIHWLRPAYDNSLIAETVCSERRPQIGTIRITTQNPALQWTEDIPIDDAEIVVCIGRGCGNGKGMELAKELARVLGASVGATRAVTDSAWMPISKQIGQTGKYIRPRIYIGIGVAGAIQHLAGMRNSDLIIAINNDYRAPIFEHADYGIVGDLYEVLPIIIESFRNKYKEDEPLS